MHATNQVSQGNYDYATELLVQCLLGDPGNPIYVQSFVSTLQKKYGQNKKGAFLAQLKERGARAALKKALSMGDWDGAIRNGIAVLKVNPWDVATLKSLATACEGVAARGDGPSHSGYADCELFYLKCAFETTPWDLDVSSQLGIALGKRNRFDEAIDFWRRVEQGRPGDEEAPLAIAALAVTKTLLWREERERGGG
ncbi:MAG: hypothetical protein ABR915_05245 [Thermoguttaceae bacterium]|jgi:tetratricopeptide (TPR) repeat protein